MNGSPLFRIFAGAVGLLIAINMLIANDFALFWGGPESALAWDSTGAVPRNYLPALLQGLIWDASGGNVFIYRLPGALWLLLAAAVFFFVGRPLFGTRTAILTLLVTGASLGVPQWAKIATADSLLFVLHASGFLFLLRFLKKPGMAWRMAFYIAVLFSALVHPFSTLIFLGIGPFFLYFSHPQGKRLISLQPWIAAALSFGMAWLLVKDQWNLPYFFRGPGYLHFQLLAAGGFLPFAGFLIAGLRDYLPKMRKGDEMALVLIFGSLTSLMAHSPALALPLALIAARQMDAFFYPNYPYGAFVKTGAILHLILIFFAAIGLMMGGLFYFEGPGFRAGMALGAAYWSMSFLGVIGLYGRQRRLAVGAPLMAGVLAVFLFWIQVFPLWENQRRAANDILAEIPAETDRKVFVLHSPGILFPNLAVYARQRFSNVQLTPSLFKLPRVAEDQPAFYLIAPAETDRIPAACRVVKASAPKVGTVDAVWVCGGKVKG